MAFSLNDEEKSKTRQYLGYFNLQIRSVIYANQVQAVPQQEILEQNMQQILDETSLKTIQDIIEEIDCLRCEIKNARKRLRVSEVAYSAKMNPYEISMLWQEDFKLCNQLAHLLAVPLYWHPSGRGISQTGGGGFIPLFGGN